MKKILLLLILIVCCVSCKNNEHKLPKLNIYFTFTTNQITVNVRESDVFSVKGRITNPNNNSRWQQIKIVENESTAIAGKHFTAPDKMEYRFPPNSTAEQSLAFTLIPENITEELILVLSIDNDYGFVNDGKHIGKITIHLIPDEVGN